MHKVFFTSDCHFFHRNIIKYESRPFQDIKEMNEELIKKWNNKVSNKDEIYILGDFAFGSIENANKILKQLNGKKYLIKGNHDKNVDNNIIKEHFAWIKDLYVLKYNKQIFVLCHYPMYSWPFKNYNSIHLFGHVHSHDTEIKKLDNFKNAYNVGVDINDFEPIEVNEILNKLNINKLNYK